MSDFVIVEYNSEIGGRCRWTKFGNDSEGNQYTVELGANWVYVVNADTAQSREKADVQFPPDPGNCYRRRPGEPDLDLGTASILHSDSLPVYILTPLQAKKYNLISTFSNLSSIQTYSENGQVDYLAKLDDFEEGYAYVELDSGMILSENLQDRSFRAGLNLAGYKPGLDPEASAWEWYSMDFEYAQTPVRHMGFPRQFWPCFSFQNKGEQLITCLGRELPRIHNRQLRKSCRTLSLPIVLTETMQNSTFYGFSEENYFVHDPRGYNTFLRGEASTFLTISDPRLLLSTIVTNISYTPQGVIVTNEDGSCISADYAICTFSVGVLQSDLVTFDPPLPHWKRIAIETFQMGIYTKIFFQFPPDRIFWNSSYQYLLYASPQRGYYPIFQPLDLPEFLPGSGIFFATVVTDQSVRVEAQPDDRTKSEILAVLRDMFGAENVPDPIDFMYPRWGQTPWARGSYSNWPPGLTLEGHQNLRANVDRLWFAGEATSQEYYGYLQGAWLEGKGAGERVATLLNGGRGEGDTRVEGEVQGDEARYEVLQGTTTIEEYGPFNGWYVSSFQEGLDPEGGGS